MPIEIRPVREDDAPALLRHAEQWARHHGVDRVSLRSGAERGAAHDFYRKHGYQQVKSQIAFTRTLG